MPTPGIYKGYCWVKQLQYMSVAECAIQFWQNWLPASEMLVCIDYRLQWSAGCRECSLWLYQCSSEWSTSFSRWSGLLGPVVREWSKAGNAPRAERRRVYGRYRGQRFQTWSASTALICGTLPTAKARLLINHHRSFVGFQNDIGCLRMSKHSLVKFCASQLLKKRSGLTSNH